MAEAYIILSVITIILFVLAQNVYVRISFDGGLGVEFNFVLLAFVISDKRTKRKKAKKKRGQSLGRAFYFVLFRRIIDFSEGCEVIVKRLALPSISFGREELSLPTHDFGWSSSLLLAYLDSKATKLTVNDNALTLIPDNGGICIDLVFKSTYFSMLKFLIRLWRDYRKTKREREIENVGK